MDYRDTITKTVERELAKESSYIKYVLLSDTGKGELHVGNETLRLPAYSFIEMSDIVRSEFEKRNPVHHVLPIGFRGEVLVSDNKELEIFATGSAGVVEYQVRKRSKED